MIFDSIDLNGNGKVTFKEWHSAVCTGPIKTMGKIKKGVVKEVKQFLEKKSL